MLGWSRPAQGRRRDQLRMLGWSRPPQGRRRDQLRMLGWSITRSQVPSGWRRATSAVAPPLNIVEVRARSPKRSAGWLSPSSVGLAARNRWYSWRIASRPPVTLPRGNAPAAPPVPSLSTYSASTRLAKIPYPGRFSTICAKIFHDKGSRYLRTGPKPSRVPAENRQRPGSPRDRRHKAPATRSWRRGPSQSCATSFMWCKSSRLMWSG
jgi:hypothetical protein